MSSDEHWWSSSEESVKNPSPIKPTVSKKKRKIKYNKLFILTKDAILKELRERKQKIDNEHGDLIEKAFLDPDPDFDFNDYLEWKRKIIAKSNNIDDIILSIFNLKDGLKNLTKLTNTSEYILNEYERMFVIQNRVWYGESRMEMSEIELLEDGVKEINRHRINAPVDKNSYCEKNWMPVLDMPNHFVKWVNPTEVVQAYPATEGYKNSSEVVFQADESTMVDLPYSPRGGSQVVPYGDYRIACTHDVDFWHNEKNDRDARYWHRFIVWDKDWNIVTISRQWKFMDGRIEFCCGMAVHPDGNDVYVTFGFQDNAAYKVHIPAEFLNSILEFPKE